MNKSPLSLPLKTPLSTLMGEDNILVEDLPPDLWGDPADADNRVVVGGKVQSLTNKGTGSIVLNPLSESDVDLQPFFTSSGMNGLGNLDIHGNTSGRGLRSNNSSGIPGGTTTFVQFAVEFEGAGTTSRNELYTVTYNAPGFVQLIVRKGTPAGSPKIQAFVWTGFQGVDVITSVDNFALGKYVITHSYDPIQNIHDLRLNGISVGSNVASLNPTPTVTNFVYGTPFNLFDSSIDGLFGDFFYQANIPSDSIRDERELDLANKYNITLP